MTHQISCNSKCMVCVNFVPNYYSLYIAHKECYHPTWHDTWLKISYQHFHSVCQPECVFIVKMVGIGYRWIQSGVCHMSEYTGPQQCRLFEVSIWLCLYLESGTSYTIPGGHQRTHPRPRLQSSEASLFPPF